MVGHFLYTEDRTVSFLVGMNELGEARDRGIDDFVAENDRKGFVTDQPLGAEDCMAESEGLVLGCAASPGDLRAGPPAPCSWERPPW